MNDTSTYWVPIAAYLIGSIPFGLIVAHLSGAGDIRKQGSGNIGATNVLRTSGRTLGSIALLLDIGKGALPVILARTLFAEDPWLTAITALAAFLGHLFPLYLNFKGGKGVATGLGIVLAWTPTAGLGALLIWIVTAFIWRYSSLSSLIAFLGLPLILFFQTSYYAMATALIMTLLVFWRHWPNIQRLHAGNEPPIGKKATPSKANPS